MHLKQGDTLHNYEIIRLLGEGGMGEVWLARDINLDREVAIKCLNPQLTRDPEFAERFRNEARIQARLTHTNIVGLHAFFEDDVNFYMVLEYARGITLRELINRTGPIPEKRAMHIFEQLVDALAHAHSHSIIHRDVKPSNIIVDTQRNDELKVTDFGIARMLNEGHLTRTGTRMGTMYYMSPEQVRAEKDIDHRSDIYSTGVVLYEILSGRLPFSSDTDSDFIIQTKIVNEPMPDPRNVYPHISNDLVDLLKWMTEKDKADRPASFDEIFASDTDSDSFAEPAGRDTPDEMASEEEEEEPALKQNSVISSCGTFVLVIIIGLMITVILKTVVFP